MSIMTLSTLCRVIRLASPKLNYVIVVGVALMYLSAYLDVLPSVDQVLTQASCIVSGIVAYQCNTSIIVLMISFWMPVILLIFGISTDLSVDVHRRILACIWHNIGQDVQSVPDI